MPDNRIKITLYASEKNKDIIKQKAQRLRLSISDLLCLFGSKLDVNKKIQTKLLNVIKEDKESRTKKSKEQKEQKVTISFRVKKEDLTLLEDKAKKWDMSLEDYLISVSLLVDIEISFKNN